MLMECINLDGNIIQEVNNISVIGEQQIIHILVIESGIATIRRKPSQMTRMNSMGGTIPRIPSIPNSPSVKPPLPPKRQGSHLQTE